MDCNNIKSNSSNNSDEDSIELQNLIGCNVDNSHPRWELVKNIQIGIKSFNENDNDSNNDTIIKPTSLNEIKQFYSTPKIKTLNSNDNSNSFKFKCYQPNAFKYLCKLFNINNQEYLNSISSDGNNYLRELPTPGKSGSLFFFTYDNKYIIKTISKQESKLLNKILPNYIEHIESNKNTLIPHFYGMFRIDLSPMIGGKKTRLIITKNIFPQYKKISIRYDLKGSFQDRETNLTISEKKERLDTITFKDTDFMNDKIKLKIENHDIKSQLIQQIENDSNFLKSLKIMDYSLLIGIHFKDFQDINIPSNNNNIINDHQDNINSLNAIHSKIQIDPSFLLYPISVSSSLSSPSTASISATTTSASITPLPSIEREIIYFIGIIDVLVLYDYKKKFAHFYKTIKYGTKKEISTIEPISYGKRFKNFIFSIITD